jgi:hypothetical protein
VRVKHPVEGRDYYCKRCLRHGSNNLNEPLDRADLADFYDLTHEDDYPLDDDGFRVIEKF